MSYTEIKKRQLTSGGFTFGAYVSVTVEGSGEKEMDEYGNYQYSHQSFSSRSLSAYCNNYGTSNYTTVAGVREKDYVSGEGGWLDFVYGYGLAPKSEGLTLIYHESTGTYSISSYIYGDAGAERLYPTVLEEEE